MADPEYRLRLLTQLGPNQWIYRNLTFDLEAMTDPYVRPWTVQGLETGIQASAMSPAIHKEIVSLLAQGRTRTIRFFDNQACSWRF